MGTYTKRHLASGYHKLPAYQELRGSRNPLERAGTSRVTQCLYVCDGHRIGHSGRARVEAGPAEIARLREAA
jgi:hypothetical protein